MWDNIQLESFGDVLRRQVPPVPGKPIQMKEFSSDLPKSCGSPWKGAYSKHGIWYRFQAGVEEDYKKLVALSFEQDGYLLSYEDFSRCQQLYDHVFLLLAKNLRGDIMGGCLSLVRRKTVHLGFFFVQEDYRHSGIGSQLFGMSMMRFEGHEFVFNLHHLHPRLYQFGLQLQAGRKIFHYVVDKPDGFPDLMLDQKLNIKKVEGLTSTEKLRASVYIEDITGLPPVHLLPNLDTLTLVAFDKDKCVGFGRRSEAAGGEVRRILVGPLYANDAAVAESLLKELLVEFYNPEDDYDFDPDPLAIYRREVHFFVSQLSQETLPLLKKLAGDGKKVQQERLWCQTSSTALLPGSRLSKIFACDNIHFSAV